MTYVPDDPRFDPPGVDEQTYHWAREDEMRGWLSRSEAAEIAERTLSREPRPVPLWRRTLERIGVL